MKPLNPEQLKSHLAAERIEAYAQDDQDLEIALARYLLNLSLCESLYPSLQFAEITLRNAISAKLTHKFGSENWPRTNANFPLWQQEQIQGAIEKLGKRKKPTTSGRVIAEMSFGFWTGFFNKCHASTGIGHHLSASIFPNAPKEEQNMKRLDQRWTQIRELRNRVFHHERIIHWKDLDQQHAGILQVISWMNADMAVLAKRIDRFPKIRAAGLSPWLNRISK